MILAIAIIIIEIVWNEEGMSHGVTIIVGGIGAYTYGIITNVIGIQVAQNITTLTGIDVTTFRLSIGLGVMLEIVPEALFTWGVTGVRGKDFLSNIVPERRNHRSNNNGHQGNNQGGGNNQGNQNQPQQNQGASQP